MTARAQIARRYQRIIDELLGNKYIYFLEGLTVESDSWHQLQQAIVEWGMHFDVELDEVLAAVEPLVRQRMLMSLLPWRAFLCHDHEITDAIDEHLSAIGVSLSDGHVDKLQNICLNIRKVKDLSASQARSRCMSMSKLRAMKEMHARILTRQNNRCVWCGVEFIDGVRQTLEHMAPKHIGDDHPSGNNWAIACGTCNLGKSDYMCWSASPCAHDFLERLHFRKPNAISSKPRWAVLARDRCCRFCRRGPLEVELGVYKKVPTGLPIASNCSCVCIQCSEDRGRPLLEVEREVDDEVRPA